MASSMDQSRLLVCQLTTRKEREHQCKEIGNVDSMAFDFSQPPRIILEAKNAFCEDLRKTPLSNYLNGVQWCPDGGHLLTASADKMQD